MGLLDIFKKKEKENVGGIEDFMTLIRVYFQSALAANVGFSNIQALPDLLAFKRTLHVPTLNNKLGLGEKKACAKMLKDIYGINDSFFKEIDQSVKKNCKTQNDISKYLYMFQGFTQETMMLLGNMLKWKFRIPGFLKGMLRKVIDSTVHDILTKDTWSDNAERKSAFSIRRYQQMLGFSEAWIQEYSFNLITLAKKEPTPSDEDVAKAEAKMKK
ncbi:MAG: hypothetical protein MJZ41_09080 [Bacteroidaceae bacterium]|nr:hypothetical protein [Bacteroidaceae bacterium]